MKVRNSRFSKTAAIIGVIFVLMISSIAVMTTMEKGADGYSARRDLSKVVPYHSASQEEYTGEACLQMIFDMYGPSITQQDIRNVTSTGPLDNDVASYKEITRAAHFSDQSWAKGNLRGYDERNVGYGGFYYDWNDEDPRSDFRIGDLYESVYLGHPVMVYMYKDHPPQLTPPDPDPPDPNNPQPPDPPDPQITPEDLAGLEKVWRVLVKYDSGFNDGTFWVHDPLPPGTGAAGGPNAVLTKAQFQSLWNVYERDDGGIGNHRIGVSASPWIIHDIEKPKNVEAGTEFEITANITYSAPPVFNGVELQDPTAFLKLPDDFMMAEGSQTKVLEMTAPRTYSTVTWIVKAPDRTYAGQDYKFYINATGNVVVSDPAHRDRIGQSSNFEVEAYGFLNHAPRITSASIDPDYIPDDGSKQPIINCLPSDEDGNIYRVTVDLSSIGMSSDQRMYDDGRTGGDSVADDGIYSYKITREVPRGEWTLMITVRDSKGAQAYANVTLKVDPLSEFTEKPDFIDAGADPAKVPNDGYTLVTIWAIVEDAENDIDEVIADLTPLGGDKKQELNDDGIDGDLFSNDDNYSFAFSVGPLISLDKYQIELKAIDETEHETIERVWVDVILPPVPPTIIQILVEPNTIVNDDEETAQVIVTVEDDNDDVDEVWVDLTPLRGGSETRMKYEGDDTWTLEFTASSSVTPGLKGKIEVTAMDLTGLSASEDFSITIEKANSAPEILDISVSKYNVRSGDEITITVNVTDADPLDLDNLVVTLDLSGFLISDIDLKDDGEGVDQEAGDLTFSGTFAVPTLLFSGNRTITVTVEDSKGAQSSEDIVLNVDALDGEVGEVLDKIGTIFYIGIPVVCGAILLILVLAAVLKSRSSNKARLPPQRYPPGRGPPMRPPPNMQGHPLGPRSMR